MSRIEQNSVIVPVIVQAVGGDLRVRGRGDSKLVAEGDDPHIEQTGEGQPYLVRCGGDCDLTVPQGVDVIVQQVGGDAKLTDLRKMAEVGAIGGDLTLRNIQSAQIGTVGGKLRVKWADGNITVKTVGDDATIREVKGAVSVDAVGADLYVRNIKGSCAVRQVGADLVLSTNFLPGQEYRFHAGGDILCRVQPGTGARFILPTTIAVGLDVNAEVIDSEDGQNQIVVLGDGQATVVIEGGAELRLVGEEAEYVFDLGIQIEEELEARLSTLEEKLSQQLDGLDARLRSKTERFISQAEQLAENAQHQIRRVSEHIHQDSGTGHRRDQPRHKRKRDLRSPATWGYASVPESPQPPAEPVSEKERLMILQMVQDKKITIEEAERLLSALDGQD